MTAMTKTDFGTKEPATLIMLDSEFAATGAPPRSRINPSEFENR